jgi:hypothetical protein
MKRIYYTLILLIVSAGQTPAHAQEADGLLTILSSTPVKTILVDDSVYVASDKIKLKSGIHKLVVQNPDRTSYQALDFISTINIRPDEELNIRVVFESLAEINSYPNGAAVSVNSEILGVTPFYLVLSEYKDKELQFKRSGYENAVVPVTDSMLVKNHLFISLQPKIINRSNNQNQFVNLNGRIGACTNSKMR